LSGNVDQSPGIGEDIEVRKDLIQDGTSTGQPESPPWIKIGCIDDWEIEELGV
jgi:hypothetical protein